MVRIFGIRFDHGDDGIFRDEASQVVDVAVSVIAENAASQPDGVRRAEVIGKRFFVVHACHVRIALLHLAQQAFFGGQNRTRAVDVNRSAFEHDALPAGNGMNFARMRVTHSSRVLCG